jgi:hypothetical protein
MKNNRLLYFAAGVGSAMIVAFIAGVWVSVVAIERYENECED